VDQSARPERSDPHVALQPDGYYYFTATAPEYDRIELRRAHRLAGLSTAEPKVIWRKHESGPMSASIWAPELHCIDGRWYLYLSRMDTPWSSAGPVTAISRPDRDWRRRGHWVYEGPVVLVKNDVVWITYSASATDANYCLPLLSAPENADLLDAKSWNKSPEPVFKTDAAASQFGPGHNSFTTTPDGKADILVYHARSYERIVGDPLRNRDRATRAQAIRWRADGTPDFGTPVRDGPCP
jgi:GH43 family beta-xylosidase